MRRPWVGGPKPIWSLGNAAKAQRAAAAHKASQKPGKLKAPPVPPDHAERVEAAKKAGRFRPISSRKA